LVSIQQEISFAFVEDPSAMASLAENPAVLVAVAVVAATMIMAYIRRLEGQIALQAACIEEQGQRLEERLKEQHQRFEEQGQRLEEVTAVLLNNDDKRLMLHLVDSVKKREKHLELRGDTTRQEMLHAVRKGTGMAELQAQLKAAIKTQDAADNANLPQVMRDLTRSGGQNILVHHAASMLGVNDLAGALVHATHSAT
jgi:predicted Holliday junction resolvase-like endonuclease